MTSAVLVLSMLPVALKLGDGGEMRAPLGAVLVGGMLTSTVLSLLYVPVAYTYFDSFSTLLGRAFHWRPRLTFGPSEPGTPAPGRVGRPLPLPIAGGASLAEVRVRAARGPVRRPERSLAGSASAGR